MAVTQTELMSPSMDLAARCIKARCINVSRVEIDYDLLAQELKHTYDSNKDRQGLFVSGDRGPTKFKAGFRAYITGRLWDFQTLVRDPSFEATVLDVVNDFGRNLATRLTS